MPSAQMRTGGDEDSYGYSKQPRGGFLLQSPAAIKEDMWRKDTATNDKRALSVKLTAPLPQPDPDAPKLANSSA
jgi:hypothetical protein